MSPIRIDVFELIGSHVDTYFKANFDDEVHVCAQPTAGAWGVQNGDQPLGRKTNLLSPGATGEVSDMRTAPSGSWRSPITSDFIVKGLIGLGQIAIDGDDVYWTEMRPSEKGAACWFGANPMARSPTSPPPMFSARTRMHEYGGGDYLVHQGTVYFSNFADQRVYVQSGESSPRPLTPEDKLRFADYRFDALRKRIVCVREDKRLLESPRTSTPSSPSISTATRRAGACSSPATTSTLLRASAPTGPKLCWLTWNHPHMPWETAELWVGSFGADGGIENATRVAGGPTESIFQPEWGPDGSLYFVSDRTDFWNLYRLRDGQIEAVCERAAEFGVPQWVFGLSTYAFVGPHLILAAYTERGAWRLAEDRHRDPRAPRSRYPLHLVLGAPRTVRRAAFLAGSPTEPSASSCSISRCGRWSVVRRSTELRFDAGDLSVPEAIEFRYRRGTNGARLLLPAEKQRLFFTARRATSADREEPRRADRRNEQPLLARHSVLDEPRVRGARRELRREHRATGAPTVNAQGKLGHRRRRRLCERRQAPRRRAARSTGDDSAITGGSAGGYTTLCGARRSESLSRRAPATSESAIPRSWRTTPAPGTTTSSSRATKIGSWRRIPSEVDIYRQRSPIHFADQLSCPVIFFQGLDDRVVLPNQSERMVEVLRQKRLPVAYVPFEGEGHGFRRAENIKRALDAELYFYSRVFGFEPADPIEPVAIENL